jgi:hypothetical protein
VRDCVVKRFRSTSLNQAGRCRQGNGNKMAFCCVKGIILNGDVNETGLMIRRLSNGIDVEVA